MHGGDQRVRKTGGRIAGNQEGKPMDDRRWMRGDEQIRAFVVN
jgi:hypothetical protein